MKPGVLETFLAKVDSKDLKVGIVGIGYVGLPVAASFAEAGFEVTAVDLREEKVATVNAGRSHLRDIGDERIRSLVDAGLSSRHHVVRTPRRCRRGDRVRSNPRV